MARPLVGGVAGSTHSAGTPPASTGVVVAPVVQRGLRGLALQRGAGLAEVDVGARLGDGTEARDELVVGELGHGETVALRSWGRSWAVDASRLGSGSMDDEEGSGAQFAVITDDALDSLRRMIGVPIVDTVEPWCYEATRDNIRHYAHGIGDDNPLWCDPSYAAGTRYGTVIAPPSFLFPLNRILSGYVGGLPGIHAMWAGADLEWFEPITRGTEVRTEAYLKELIEHQTRFAGRAIQQIYHVDYYDVSPSSPDRLLASGDSWCFRTERDTAREAGTKYDEARRRPPMRYDAETIARIHELYRQEEVRGAEPRPAAGVEVGEALPVMVKGPMTVTGFIAFAQGWGGLYIRANKLAYQQLRKHPGLGIPDRFGIPDVPERVHWDSDLATLDRYAGGLRLRPRALLVADAPPDELDGGRRVPGLPPVPHPPPQRGGGLADDRGPGDRRRRRRRGPPAGRGHAGGAQPARGPVGDRLRRGPAARALNGLACGRLSGPGAPVRGRRRPGRRAAAVGRSADPAGRVRRRLRARARRRGP